MIELSLVKQHLRVLHDREDAVINAYTKAAFSAFENYTERKLYATLAELEQDAEAPENAIALSYTKEPGEPSEPEDPQESEVIFKNDIVSGALIYIGYLYTVRDMDAPMPRATEALWSPYRLMRFA